MMAFLVVIFMLIITVPSLAHGLSAANQQAILNCHNAYRSQLAKGTAANITGLMPAGANLVQLKYNATIESIAQSWANQCTMSHSSSSTRPGLGENLYMTSSSTVTDAMVVKSACDSWWNELKQNGIQCNLVLNSTNWYPIGHWSQQAWAKTGQIGCAVARCPNSTWKTYVVCNYGPAGNYLGQTVYTKGSACSGCAGIGATCNSTSGLCLMP